MEKSEIRIRVKHDNKEIETSIPWSERTATFDTNIGTSPRSVLDMIEEMITKLNKING